MISPNFLKEIRDAEFFIKIKIPLKKYLGTLSFACKSIICAKLVLEKFAKEVRWI